MVEPVTAVAPRAVGRATFVQGWREVTFLHWPVDPAAVAALLPAGTRPDTLNEVSYVGLVPFRMRGVGLLAGPGVPYLGTFSETNVRLYSVDGDGRRGVVFRSLDASRLLPVLLGRASVRLPYVWSSMRLRRAGDVVRYTCRRRWRRRTTSRVAVRVGPPVAEPSELEHFVTARWGLHVAGYGRTWYLPNEHPQWPLNRAELLELEDGLVAAAGLPAPAGPPVSVLYSPGVPVRFGVPSVVR